MHDFFKYVTVGAEDKRWGLFLNVAGRARIMPHSVYPSPDHPTGYYFSWGNGRKLQEFQLNYITEGSGVLENDFGKFQIRPGTLIITRPGIWHRYRPIKKYGWLENYIGFDGELAHFFLDKSIFSSGQSVIHCGVHEEIIDTYYKIFRFIQKEEPGFQQLASGLVIQLLGYLIALQKQRDFSGKRIETVIQKVRFYMRENIEKEINLPQLAEQHHIAYTYFRKMFKKYTGVAPHQYHLELKIMRAKELLLTTDKSIKEISYELGFQSIYYFSRLFKKKEGVSPSNFRKRVM
ncbi:MAG: AraC family transcriptional regulator [Bacteroidetes bacterium]|nr:AraC family transcriptional regulator [Bacteroidota bacterium]